MKVRIQKVLAAAGMASRRAVEMMIVEGRISVNGQVVAKLPCFVEPADEILVDGQTVRKRPERHVYYLLNKPRGVICTQKDLAEYDRPRATDLVPTGKERVYCVGRMDEESTGLLILTNDGKFTNHLTHPRYGVVKSYVARVAGRVTPADLAALRKGMYMDGRRTGAVEVRIIRQGVAESLVEIKLAEGHNRQVQRMLARLGHNVRRLHRRAIGPLTDRGLKIGNYRPLTADEVQMLRKAAGVPAE